MTLNIIAARACQKVASIKEYVHKARFLRLQDKLRRFYFLFRSLSRFSAICVVVLPESQYKISKFCAMDQVTLEYSWYLQKKKKKRNFEYDSYKSDSYKPHSYKPDSYKPYFVYTVKSP